ncbi:MAG: HD domain-containing phosphohydrolase [Candidatus Brocadia sp.]
MNLNVKKRILFVDDEQNFLDGMRRMLRAQAEVWDMSFIANPYAAFDQLCKTGYDAVVSDIKMPCMDGFELLEKIRSTEWIKDIPVLILTGLNENHLKQRALDLGATDLLNKPVNREDLIARLKSMLRLKSYQDEIIAQNALLELKVRERTLDLEESRLDIIWRLAKMAEFRDYDTGNHIVRVGYYCRVIAEALGLEQEFIKNLFVTSPLHNIGKIGIPDNILLKSGKLSPEEFEVMKKHCAIGAEILRHDCKCKDAFLLERSLHIHTTTRNSNNPLLEMASTIAMSHHERWDGTGYPSGLAGDKIPMESRIVALSDVYDALCSVRPYKPAFTEGESLAIIRDEAGRHFDPVVYAAFEKSIDKLRSIRIRFSDQIHR